MCYSALAYLLLLRKRDQTVNRVEVRKMIDLSPLERLKEIGRDEQLGCGALVEDARKLYADFLQQTDAPKVELYQRFEDKAFRDARSKEARDFGDALFRMVEELGKNNPLYRFIVV